MIADIKGTQPLSLGVKGRLGGRMLPASSRSTLRSGRTSQPVRSVLEMNKSKSSNGATSAAAVDAETVTEEVKQFMRYRLATDEVNNDALYKSTAWSVHNRLVDSFEKTHKHWE